MLSRMAETPLQHTCAACRVLDQADGVEDGNLFASIAQRHPPENVIVRNLRKAQDVLADDITRFAGSMTFVYLHLAWFTGWMVLNVGLFGTALRFDRFPFGLLTMVVSLEAIFLATFVMISQNRQAARADIRSELDFETNLRAEIWAVHIGQQLGIDPAHVEHVVTAAIATSRTELGSSMR
ncbi:MAG: hypothetical protein QOE45_587 [Frankiaceae bacterium]|jgi:uncharacterized membrane protein|nr:hypothetical protein [Frankiaceae bacterium]